MYTLHSNIISHISVHLLQHSEIKAVQLDSEQIYRRKNKNICLGEGGKMNLQMAFDMRYGESSHSHQLQNSLRRSLCAAAGSELVVYMMRKIEEKRSKKMIMVAGKGMHILSCPPSLWMAWTKQWCRSGVHLRRGTFDLLYCLTPPLLSRPTTAVLTMVIYLSASSLAPTTPNRPASKN